MLCFSFHSLCSNHFMWLFMDNYVPGVAVIYLHLWWTCLHHTRIHQHQKDETNYFQKQICCAIHFRSESFEFQPSPTRLSQIDNHQLVSGELCHLLHYLQQCVTSIIFIISLFNHTVIMIKHQPHQRWSSLELKDSGRFLLFIMISIVLNVIIHITQVPLNLITATTLMLVKSGQLEDRGLVFGLLSFFLLVAALVAATIETKEEKRE